MNYGKNERKQTDVGIHDSGNCKARKRWFCLHKLGSKRHIVTACAIESKRKLEHSMGFRGTENTTKYSSFKLMRDCYPKDVLQLIFLLIWAYQTSKTQDYVLSFVLITILSSNQCIRQYRCT